MLHLLSIYLANYLANFSEADVNGKNGQHFRFFWTKQQVQKSGLHPIEMEVLRCIFCFSKLIRPYITIQVAGINRFSQAFLTQS